MSGTRRPADATGAPPPLNRAALAAAVAAGTDLPANKAFVAVDTVMAVIADALRNGRPVRLTGFGSFAVVRRKASTGRNPQTGETIAIPSTSSVRFKPGRGLKAAIGCEGG